MLDTKIINGTIVDGSGSARFSAAIGIRDGRIAAIGEVPEEAREIIDAQGLVVAPGFVDVHTHYDAQVFWDPTLSPSCYHGVTTVFGGFCGFSIAPLTPAAGEYLKPMLARVEGMPLESLEVGVPWDWTSFGSYLDKIDGTLALNAGFFAGHSAIRRVVMGERAVGEQASNSDLDAMLQLLDASLTEGALGFSTTISVTHNDATGKPVPSRHATREEMLALAGVCRDHEGTALEMVVGDFNDNAINLLTDLSLAAQRPINWNVMSINSTSDFEQQLVAKQLAASDYAHDKGARVVALTVPQTMTIRINLLSGFVFDAFPGWDKLFSLPLAERLLKLREPGFRDYLQERATSKDAAGFAMLARWENMTIAQVFSAQNKSYEGIKIGEIATQLGKTPFDTLIDIALVDELKTSFMPLTGGDDAATYALRAKLWLDHRTVIGGSDAGAHLDMIDTFAFSTKVLGKGVREHQVIGLEQAVQQLTQVPAQLMGLRERGELRVGWHADIVLFDADKIGSGPTYTRFDMPAGAGRLYADAIGIERVLVNGRTIVHNNVYTGAVPGTVLRSGRDTQTVAL
jgi:N-acyl-D-aspartate/D-glutamate deacylase